MDKTCPLKFDPAGDSRTRHCQGDCRFYRDEGCDIDLTAKALIESRESLYAIEGYLGRMANSLEDIADIMLRTKNG